jgi:hypothetical protein
MEKSKNCMLTNRNVFDNSISGHSNNLTGGTGREQPADVRYRGSSGRSIRPLFYFEFLLKLGRGLWYPECRSAMLQPGLYFEDSVLKFRIIKILLGVFMIGILLIILSLLSGADYVMNVILFFTDDKLCEDRNDDGVDDFCQYWNNGELIRLEWDTQFDGKTDVWLEYRQEGDRFQLDSNYDGKVDYIEQDLPGGNVRIEIDSDFDGTFERKEELEIRSRL